MVNMPTTPPATHSPLPWHTGTGKAEIIVYGANGYAICDCKVYHGKDQEGEAAGNAALIATACNDHAKLVEALRSFPSLPFIEDMTTDEMADKLREISAWLDTDARSALAAAGEA